MNGFSIDSNSPLQVSQVLQRIHELWQHACKSDAGRPASEPISDHSQGHLSSSDEGRSASPPPPLIDQPPKLSYSQGRITLTSSTSKTLAELGTIASDVAHEVKEIFATEAGLLAHEAQLFKDALAAGAERLLHFSELPHRWKNNKHIHKGYR